MVHPIRETIDLLNKTLSGTILMEGNVACADEPFNFQYYNVNEELVDYYFPSAKELVIGGISMTRDPLVKQWFSTVFLNWIKNECPNYEEMCDIANIEPASINVFMMPIKEYIHEFLADMIFGDPDPRCYPSKTRYSEKTSDTRFDEDVFNRLPDWMKKPGVKVAPFIEQFMEDHFPTQEIVDWMTSPQGKALENKFQKMSVMDVVTKQAQWHNTPNALNSIQEVEGTDYKIIYDFGDGFRMVQLLTPTSLDKETKILGHCVGKGGYDEAVEKGTVKIYSLRDKDNLPVATMDVRGNSVNQVKGKRNGPVDEAAHSHIWKFILRNKLTLDKDHDNVGL